jgi:hypothetical protein
MLGAVIAGSGALLGADVKTQIVLLKTYITTNTIPGYTGGYGTKIETNSAGILIFLPSYAVAITYPPRTEIITNYVLGYLDGTNAVELITAEKR